MKRGVAIGAAVLILAALAFVLLRARREAALAPEHSSPGLSEEEKERIRSFWNVYRQGEALRREGKWDEAVPRYREALELDPAHEDSLYNLANCYLELDRFAEALESLERLARVNPLSQRAYRQIGLVHSCPQAGRLFDLEAAGAALRRAFEINKEETGALLLLGEVELIKGHEERACELLEMANRSNFRAVEGYYLRGYVRWREGRRDEARALLVEAVRQSRKPVVVAGVPGEGDTRPGSGLPPSTVKAKRPITPFWSDLPARYPEDAVSPEALEAEFAQLAARLAELRKRLEVGPAPEVSGRP